MDDLQYGTRNKRGDWTPNKPIAPAPVWNFPPTPLKILKWLPHFFLPWNLMFFAIAVIYWFWLTPSKETLQTLSFGWIGYLLMRNALATLLIYGALELWFNSKRKQGTQFKYNGRFAADKPSDVFMFKSQNIDNMIRSFGTGVPIWTAYEVLILWCYANGWGPWTAFADNPVWLLAFALLLPFYHELHFYCIHRLIHIPILYKYIHSVHHNSINPTPWSSLSMHPLEHLLYWSDALIHLLLPSHPLLVLYNLQITGTGAVVGHIGFDKIVIGDKAAIDTHAYAHYLHHKYFEVNYGDGLMPLDKWTGTWHDGTKQGDALMNARLQKKKAKLNANPA